MTRVCVRAWCTGLDACGYMRKRVGVAPGTVAYRLIEARERAFQKELGAQSPMGRMLASKQRSADVAASAVSSDV